MKAKPSARARSRWTFQWPFSNQKQNTPNDKNQEYKVFHAHKEKYKIYHIVIMQIMLNSGSWKQPVGDF